MSTCKICNEEFDNQRKLSCHIRHSHKIKPRQYYDQYVKGPDDGKCVECGKSTAYQDVSKGYKLTCSFRCSAIKKRKELANDPVRRASFAEKVAENQARIWAAREETGEGAVIRAKIGLTVRSKNSTLCDDEIGRIAYRRRRMEETGIFVPDQTLSDWEAYKKNVRSATSAQYRKNKKIINPNNYSRREYELDHIVSVRDGFRYNIPVEIMASPVNLQMLETRLNKSKGTASWMTPSELFEKWQSTIKESLPPKTPKRTKL